MRIEKTIDDVAKQMFDELAIDLATRKIDALPSREEIRGAIAFAFCMGAPERMRLPEHVRIAARLLKARRWGIPITIHSGTRGVHESFLAYARKHGIDIPGA